MSTSVRVHGPPFETLRALTSAGDTGTLSIASRAGAAEVRIAGGVIEDAVFLRAEGEKALYRVLALDEASGAVCSFVEGGATGLRRIRGSTETMLADAGRVVSELRALRAAFGDVAGPPPRPLVAFEPEPSTTPLTGPGALLSSAARALLPLLRTPVLLDDLLDLASGPDVETLSALLELREARRLRVLPSPSTRVPLGSAEQIARIVALLDRGRRSRFAPQRPRLVLAGMAHRLAVVVHSTLCIEGATPPPEGSPAVPMAHPVARIALDPDLEVEIVSCPLVPAYAPLWQMAMAGAVAVVRLDDAASSLLDPICEAAGVRVLDASMLVGPYDETNVVEVAMLVRAALEA